MNLATNTLIKSMILFLTQLNLFVNVVSTNEIYSIDEGTSPTQTFINSGEHNTPEFKSKFRNSVVRKWEKVLKLAEEHSYVNSFLKIYKNSDIFKIQERDMIGLVKELADDMNQAIMKKLKAVQNLVKVTEESYLRTVEKEENKNRSKHRAYYNAKRLKDCRNFNKSDYSDNRSEVSTDKGYVDVVNNEDCLILDADKHFMDLEVNLSYSTVHVPTIIYENSIEILNSAAWSFNLNKAFSENYRNDPEITWQYFCSATGLYRTWPGTRWTYPENMPANNQVDLFDCRVRTWYVKATSSPRDVIILIDNSGSMTGIKRSIAIQTVETILDTLSDDDFVNILSFNNEVKYVDKCFNHGLIQATVENRKHLQEAIATIQTKDIASFSQAFEKAFEILNEARSGISQTENVSCICQSHYANSSYSQAEEQCKIPAATSNISQSKKMFLDSSGCNKMIMVVTDGSSDTVEKVFRKYNWPVDYNNTCHAKETRVFTYLIGREISDERAVRWMACSNKGFYAHVSTLEDIQDNVQDYIPVIARPIALFNDHVTVWSSVFLDIEKNDPLKEYKWYPYKVTDVSMPMDAFKKKTKKYHLMISVAQPAFQRTKINEMYKLGGLLGAVAVDIPVRLLHEFAPAHRLGVHGHSFLINHNGYVIYHPDLRPVLGEYRKRNYHSIDIDALEIPLTLENYTYPLPESPIQKLRREMIKGYTGNLSAVVKRAFDDMRRVEVVKNLYYFSTLGDKNSNPFSLGISVREPYGLYEALPKSINNYMIKKAFAFANEEFVSFSNMVHCNATIENSAEYENVPILYYLQEKLKYKHLPSCSTKSKKQIIDRMIADLYIMSMFNETFEAESKTHMDSCCPEATFIVSSSGVTSYWCEMGCDDEKSNKIRTFLNIGGNTVDSVFYSRTVNFTLEESSRNAKMGKNESAPYLFSLFFVVNEHIDEYVPHLAITTAILLPSQNRRNKSISYATAVVGIIVGYEGPFHTDFLMKLNRNCGIIGAGINHCFIVDQNGYIIAHNPDSTTSDSQTHLGKFFGEVNGLIMQDLITKGIFEKVKVFDFQSVCVSNGQKEEKMQSSSAKIPSLLRSTLIHLIAQSVRNFAFNICALLLNTLVSMAQRSLTDLLPTHIDYQKPLRYHKEQKTTARQLEACIEESMLYQTRWKIDSVQAFQANCCSHTNERDDDDGDDCLLSYTIQGLPRSNLYLIHFQSSNYSLPCQDTMLPLKIVKTPISLNETEKCIRLKSTPYRERPQKCYFVNEIENATTCSKSGRLLPSYNRANVILVLMLLLCLLELI